MCLILLICGCPRPSEGGAVRGRCPTCPREDAEVTGRESCREPTEGGGGGFIGVYCSPDLVR